MASLRRKPVDVTVASVDTAQPLAVGIDSNPPPASPPTPAPESPPKTEAENALRLQLEALQQSETLNRQRDALQSAEGHRQDWLAKNPLAQKHYSALGALHNEALGQGLIDVTPSYFDFMNQRLAELHTQHPATVGTHLINEMQQRTALERAPPPAPERQRTNIVSAPVSREVPSASGKRENGKTTLSAEQSEYARIAGVSEAEYARQLARLNNMRADGSYSERRE
jgi:hypothetical protein